MCESTQVCYKLDTCMHVRGDPKTLAWADFNAWMLASVSGSSCLAVCPHWNDRVVPRVISLLCVSAQTPVFWLICRHWGLSSCPKRRKAFQRLKWECCYQARAGRCWMFVCPCTNVRLETGLCVCSCITSFENLGCFLQMVKANSGISQHIKALMCISILFFLRAQCNECITLLSEVSSICWYVLPNGNKQFHTFFTLKTYAHSVRVVLSFHFFSSKMKPSFHGQFMKTFLFHFTTF